MCILYLLHSLTYLLKRILKCISEFLVHRFSLNHNSRWKAQPLSSDTTSVPRQHSCGGQWGAQVCSSDAHPWLVRPVAVPPVLEMAFMSLVGLVM